MITRDNITPRPDYRAAVEAIKTAILQGQYEAANGVNRIQLAVYFAVGKYISANTRKGAWGTGAVKAISEQLQKELPGLRGFSATQMKDMRRFYEEWNSLDPNSTVTTVELEEGEKQQGCKSTVATVEIARNGNPPDHIDIFHTLQINDIKDFPVEHFFKVPFTHHIAILAGAKTITARYYYIRRTAEEHLPVKTLRKLIKENAYGKRESAPNNFMATMPDSRLARRAVEMFKDDYLLNFINVEEIGQRDADDHLRKPHENASIGIVLCKSANKNYAEYMVRQYDKPMGVATYTTSADMPERLRNALPDIEELKKLL